MPRSPSSALTAGFPRSDAPPFDPPSDVEHQMNRKIVPTLLAAAGALLLPLVVTTQTAYSAVAVPIRANANGPALSDGAGNAWSAGKAYASGNWGYDTLYGAASTASAIAGTADDSLYQSYDLFSGWAGYKFDVANGTYNPDGSVSRRP